MKNFKDFLYKSNDIILAIVILLAALAVIGWRTQVIMDYPKTLTEVSQEQEEQAKDSNSEQSATTSQDQSQAQSNTNTTTQSASTDVWKDGKLTKDVSVEIKAGASAEEAVKPLIDAKLFKDYNEFSQACRSAKVNPESVRADKFTFKAGATQADIVKKVTQ